MLGLSLLYVGAVLCLNGVWLVGRIEDREIVVINLVAAGISALVALQAAVLADDIIGVRSAAMTLLFAITYLWVAYIRLQDCDGRGLGWFSLFVSITVLPVAVLALAQADSVMTFWLGLSWAAWSGLWFLYFLLLALQKTTPEADGMDHTCMRSFHGMASRHAATVRRQLKRRARMGRAF